MTSAFLNFRSAVAPRAISLATTTDFVRLFALDRLRVDRSRLVCHWHRDADGRLACVWESHVGQSADSASPGYRHE